MRTDRFEVIAAEILALRKDFQVQSQKQDKILAKMEERDTEAVTHRRALEVLLKEVLARQNSQP